MASATAPLANSTRALAMSRWEQDREPRRPHFGGLRAAGQVQHQVEVVDHQVEHDRDVGAPRLERRQPLALDVPRPVEIGLRRAKRAVVALDVPDLKLHPAARRRGDQGVGLGQRRRERLLHQHRDAAPQRPEAHLGVGRRRHGDGDGLDPAQQRIEVGEGGHAQLPGDLVGRASSISYTPTSSASSSIARCRAWCRPSAPTPTTPIGSRAVTPARPARTTRRTPGTVPPRGGRQLAARPLERLRQVQIGVEEEPVGALERGHGFAREAGPLEADRVEPVELHRIAHRLHVRRDVLVDPGAAADEGVGADGDELVDAR